MILRFIAAQRHVTTADIHRYVCGDEGARRNTERRLARLCRQGYLAWRRLYPERGSASPRYYHLLLKGARALGQTRLAQQHYRQERRDCYAARHAGMELAYQAALLGWPLLSREADCRLALAGYMLAVSRAEHGQRFPAQSLAPLLPARISPDRILLVGGQEALILIIAHPHGQRGFWLRRRARYQRVLSIARAVAVVPGEAQRREAAAVLAQPPTQGRFLVLLPAELPALFARLQVELQGG
jgi:hypothetical protein